MDLFVRVSNQVAVNMYKRLGYSVYRTVIEYYSASNGEPDEDAYGQSAMLVLLQLVWSPLIISDIKGSGPCLGSRERGGGPGLNRRGRSKATTADSCFLFQT